MAQHYPAPQDVLNPFPYPRGYALRKLKEIINKDGLIVPILVNKMQGDKFFAADQDNGDKVVACRELGFKTILVETEWTEDDL